MKTNKILLAAMGVALAVVAVNANAAGTAVANLNPTLTITGVCGIALTGNNNFPLTPYSVIAGVAIVSATSTITATCPGTPYELTADAGLNSAAGVRHLGASPITYTLGVTGDAINPNWGTNGHLKPLGTGAIATAASETMINMAVPGATDTFNIIATTSAIPAGQAVGTYSDTVIVTASW